MTISRIVALGVLGALALVIAIAVVSGLGSSDDAVSTRPATAPEGDAQDEQAGTNEDTEAAVEAPATTAPPVLRERPELIGLDGWLQSPYESLDELDGKVYIVEFWTFGCFNCKAVKPHLRALYDMHQADGLEIIGVHSPEFDFEKDVDSIQQAANDQRVNWPIALDTNKKSFRLWQEDRRFWPRTYVVDQNGDIRYDHIGEGGYDELGETVAYLLENGA